MKKKTIKAWAVINENGLCWGEIEPVNGEFGSGLASPLISTNKEWIKSWYLENDEKIVSCTIIY
jgi:hypothetical protein